MVLVERTVLHTAARVAVLSRAPEDLAPVLRAHEKLAQREIPINLVALLPLGEADLPALFDREARRIGALVAALDASLPWPSESPMMVRCLPGRIRGQGELAPLSLSSIQAFEMKRYFGEEPSFLQPQWDNGQALWWPKTPRPPHSHIEVPPLELPTATLLSDTLRQALRKTTGAVVDFLPMVGDPTGLHALKALTSEVTAYRGSSATWEEALEGLAALPAPPHFCARC